MNLLEAREFLGVTAEDDAKAVRRAYLRLLKKHKPESDPEGFQRLREAFELAKRGVGFVPKPLPAELASLLGGEGAALAPAATEPAETAPSDPLDGLKRSIERIEDLATRVAVARDAVAEFPDRPDAHWMLFWLLDEAADDASLLEAARAAADRGFVELLVEVHHMGLRLAPEDHVRVAERLEHTEPLAAVALLAKKEPQRAEALFHAAIERADAKGDTVHHYHALDALFGLFATGSSVGPKAYARYREHLTATGTERQLQGTQVLRFLLLRELAGLPESFPPAVLGPLAEAARSLGHDDQARAALRRLAAEDRDQAKRAAAGLRSRAKQLAGLFAQDLVRPIDAQLDASERLYGNGRLAKDVEDFERNVRTGGSGPGIWGSMLLVFALLNGLRACGRGCDTGRRSPDVQRILELSERARELQPPVPTPGRVEWLPPSGGLRHALCEGTDGEDADPRRVEACAQARELEELLDGVRCEDAAPKLNALFRTAQDLAEPVDPQRWVYVQREVADLCAPLPEEGAPDG
ncbi:MAG: J domain-containing protein [Myxococcota bacterium]